MITDKLKLKKLKLWQDKLKQLEDLLQETLQKRGEAAREGDLRENAAYALASEDADMYRVRIDQVKNIIKTLESGTKE